MEVHSTETKNLACTGVDAVGDQKPMQCVGILTLCGDRGVVALNLGFLGRW